MKQELQLDKDPVPKLFFKYYIPSLTSLISVTIYQITDGLILGQYVGETGVAAVGLWGPVIVFFIAFMLMLVIGGGIMMGKHLGAKDLPAAQEVFQFSITWGVIFGGLIWLLAPFLTHDIVKFTVGETEALFQDTYDYFFWGFMWLPFFLVRMVLSNAISQDGAPKVTRNAILFAVVLNILLDILLIIIIPLGTKGASMATGISVFVSTLYLLIYMGRGKGKLTIRKFRPVIRLQAWRKLISHGLPSLISEVSFATSLLLISNSLVSYGEVAVAVFGLLNYISFIFIRFFTSAMISVLPIFSFNIGASLPHRVLGTLKFSVGFTLALGLLVTVMGFLFPGFFVTLFSKCPDMELHMMAKEAFGLFFLMFLVVGPNYVLGAYFQSIHMPVLSIVMSVIKGIGLTGLVVLVMPQYFGIESLWLARPVAEIGTFLVVGILTLLFWRRFYDEGVIVH